MKEKTVDAKKAILVVDDEAAIREMIGAYLDRSGYRALCAGNGAEALALLRGNPVALVLLDLMLPDMAGEELCRRIREGEFAQVRADIPLIMVTAKIDERSIVRGLRLGADDYVTKPFSPRELVARIGAILRRSGEAEEEGGPLLLFDLVIDQECRLVSRRGTRIDLTVNEFRILALLASRPHRIFTRDEIISHVKGADFDGFDRAIDTHIKNLRQKLADDPRHPRYVETVYGMGYRAMRKEQ
jgi:DNA-binding response OmpR family regulator